MSTPFKGEMDSSVIGGSWRGALKFCTTMLRHSRTNFNSNTCPLHEWYVCKSTTRAPQPPVAIDGCNVYLQCLQRSEKGRVIKSDDLPYLTHQRHVHHGQLDRSSPDNTCPGSGAWQTTSTCNSLTLVEVTTLDTRQYSSILRGSTNSSPSTCQEYYPRYQTDSLTTGQSLSTLDNLFRLQAGLELGGLMYCLGPTWHSETRVNPLR